ncbi:MAG TPA: phosphonate ABC transporter substrate-binding protein [Hyphomicrobiaceae bacterium]|nr:phosphonate ABC transporter substrate-binding protein [Hyphomicrobiaceae bacterium]
MLRPLMAASIAVTLAITPAAAAEDVNFGIISTETTTNLKAIWEPFLADMTKQTGLNIKAFYASDYAGVIEAMRFNKVQVAWFGNKSAMEAVDRAGGEIFAQTVDKDGNPGYWSHIIVHKDSPLKTLEDVLKCDASLDFGIGDPNSTSGFLVPTTFIFSARSIDPKKCFKTVRNANHEANALAVANKLVQAATNNNENLQRLAKTAPDKAKEIRVIWTSPLIPSDPLVWRKDLDAGLKKKIADFIFSYATNNEEEKKVLAGLQWAPFKKSDNNQLLPIRQMEVNKALAKLKADTSVAEADKSAQVAELQKQFDELGKKIAATK